jgi:predicted DsbA family dithiol-disulfide isomerase
MTPSESTPKTAAPIEVTIWVDPGCPWCFQTARWARQLEADGVIRLRWAFLSLEIHNSEAKALDLATHTGSVPAMRVALLIREELGQTPTGRFYDAVAGARHHRDEQLKLPETIRAALAEAGLDEAYLERALADEGTAERLMDEYRAISERAIGVPTFEFDGPGGPTMFGPVIARLPEGDEALELWEHFAWLARNENVYEVKRVRSELPDLEGIRLAQLRRAKRLASEKAGQQ